MKLKLLLAISILLTFSVYAQQDKQSIELPDFVITGVQSAELPSINKGLPDYVSVLSKEFLKPTFSPDEFTGYNFSNPIEQKYPLFSKTQEYNKWIKAGAGYYTLPKADIYYDKDFGFGLFKAKFSGDYQRDYVKYGDANKQDAELGADFFVNNKSAFLPGSRISIDGGFGRKFYRFFGSANSSGSREIYSGKFNAEIVQTYTETFNFGLRANDKYTYFNEEDFRENLIDFDAFADLYLEKVGIHVKGGLVSQQLSNQFSIGLDNTFFDVSAGVSINPFKSLRFKFGMNYARQDSSTFFSPTGMISFELDDNLEMIGEFNPRAEFHTIEKLLNKNRYLNLGNKINVFETKTSNFRLAIKYEYNKYFVVAGGFESASSDNFPYLADSNTKGRFDIYTLDKIKQTGLFLNFLFHPGPMGMFFASLKYSDVKDSSSNFIPYNPVLTVDAAYSYLFQKKIKGTIKALYLKDIYTNISNTNRIASYFNLGLEIEYRLNNNLSFFAEINNLTDNRNFLYSGYREMPFDLMGGIYYRW